MKESLNLSIGILAWKSGKTLVKTLETYRKNGLFDLVTDTTVFFQETSEEDIQIAKKFGLKYISSQENVGIDQGFCRLAEQASTENILLLEHDWNLIENKTTTENRLKSGIALLDEGFQVVKYRHRQQPGIPLYTRVFEGRELDYYDDWHECTAPHLLESLHWLDPAEKFPDKIQKQGEYFVTTSRWGNWTNNPCLFKKDFYLNVVIPMKGQGIDLERKMAKWWPKQDFRVAHGEGLFMHNDIAKFPPETVLKKTKKLIKKILGRS